MGDVRLTSPRLVIIREGHEDLELQTDNRDLILWDTTRLRHKWPKLDDAPFLWMTFISWAAARRTGAINADVKFETWRDEVRQVAAQEDDEEVGNPTRLGLVPD